MKCSRVTLSLLFAAVVGFMPATRPVNGNMTMAADIGPMPPAELTAGGLPTEGASGYWYEDYILGQAEMDYPAPSYASNPEAQPSDDLESFEFVDCECGYCEYCLLRQERLQAEQAATVDSPETASETSLDEESPQEAAETSEETLAEESYDEYEAEDFPYKYGYGEQDFDYSYYESFRYGKYGDVSIEAEAQGYQQYPAEEPADTSEENPTQGEDAERNPEPTEDESAAEEDAYADEYSAEYVYEEEGYFDPYAGGCDESRNADETAHEAYNIYEVGNQTYQDAAETEDESETPETAAPETSATPGMVVEEEFDRYEYMPQEEYADQDGSYHEEQYYEEGYYEDHIYKGGPYHEDGYGYATYDPAYPTEEYQAEDDRLADEEAGDSQLTTDETAGSDDSEEAPYAEDGLTQEERDYYHDMYGDNYEDYYEGHLPPKTYWTHEWSFDYVKCARNPKAIETEAAAGELSEETAEGIADVIVEEIAEEVAEELVEELVEEDSSYDEEEYDYEKDYYANYAEKYGDYENWSDDSLEYVHPADAYQEEATSQHTVETGDAEESADESSVEEDSSDGYVYEEGEYCEEYGDEKYWSYLKWEHAYATDADSDSDAETDSESSSDLGDDEMTSDSEPSETQPATEDVTENETSDGEYQRDQYESDYGRVYDDYDKYGDEYGYYAKYDEVARMAELYTADDPEEGSYWSQDDRYADDAEYMSEEDEVEDIYRQEFDYGYSEDAYTDFDEESEYDTADDSRPETDDPFSASESSGGGFDYELEMYEDHEYFQGPYGSPHEGQYFEDESYPSEPEMPRDTFDADDEGVWGEVSWEGMFNEAAHVNAGGPVAGVFVSLGGRAILQLDEVLRGLSYGVR